MKHEHDEFLTGAPISPAPDRPHSSADRILVRVWPHALLLMAGIIWGATFSLARMTTEGGAHPLGLALWQAVGGGCFLLMICALRRRLPRIDVSHLGFYAVCGTIGTTVPSSLFFYAAPHVPAGILAITVTSVPLITYAASLAFRIDSFASRRLLGIVLGMVAVILVIAPETALPSRKMTLWVLVALIGSAFYAAENIYVAMRRPASTDSLALVCGMLLMAAAILSPLVFLTGSTASLMPPWTTLQWAMLTMMVISAVAYAMFLQLIQTAGPVFASQTGYVVTLSGVGWGMLIFGEQHSMWIWTALAVMLAGLALVTPLTRSQDGPPMIAGSKHETESVYGP